MTGLEYLLTKCGLEWNYPNCPGGGDCSKCNNKKMIEYNLDRYKARMENKKKKKRFNVIIY